MLIIGIAGGTGSGKTTVVHQIMNELPQTEVGVISQDSYYKENNNLSFEERALINFDHPRAIDFDLLVQHLKDLKAGKTIEDLDMFIPHQANLRIAQFVQQKFGLPDEKIHNNIQKYGNTTAASIPIALTEAWEQGKIKSGDTVVLAAFGSGFTWASALLKW